MNAPELLETLRRRGVSLSAINGNLRYQARRGALTPEDLAMLKANKAAILAALSRPALSVVTTTRADLEALHPATVNGIPLAAILDHADEADYPDLTDPAILAAFAASLVATGYIDPTPYRNAPKRPPQAVLVRCRDCAHFIPSQTDPKGIGGCRVNSPAQLYPAPWPGTGRRCDAFEARP